VNSLPKTVTRQRRDCDLNPGPSAPESSMLTTRPPSHPKTAIKTIFTVSEILYSVQFDIELMVVCMTDHLEYFCSGVFRHILLFYFCSLTYAVLNLLQLVA